MTQRPDQKQLLDDVLAESSPPDFRAALLGEVLRHARRRRHRRQSGLAAGVLGILFLAAWLAGHDRVEKLAVISPPPKSPLPKSYQVVDTQPFPAGALVTTANCATVTPISSSAPVTQIATSSAGYRYLNDEELLQLAGPGTAILIRTGPDSEELVFADPTNVSKPGPEN